MLNNNNNVADATQGIDFGAVPAVGNSSKLEADLFASIQNIDWTTLRAVEPWTAVEGVFDVQIQYTRTVTGKDGRNWLIVEFKVPNYVDQKSYLHEYWLDMSTDKLAAAVSNLEILGLDRTNPEGFRQLHGKPARIAIQFREQYINTYPRTME